MAFYLVAMEPNEFNSWYARQTEPAGTPTTPIAVEGEALFFQNGCGACHTIRGTQAVGKIGPDLSHLGDRVSLAAGTFPNNQGTLAGWIASAQHLKPGNSMPSFGHLRGRELRAIAAYLGGLK